MKGSGVARVVVIGGTGHIGGYLIPRLVAGSHDVTVISRGKSTPYRTHAAWEAITMVAADRTAHEDTGTFASIVAGLEPDVVIDLICFQLGSAQHLVDVLRGRLQHYLHCGTIWVHGPTLQAPTTEEAPRRPFGAYGIAKAAIESFLLGEARRGGFPATVLHPGHICGPGWTPINPAGNADIGVFATLAAGDALALPNLGLETLNHVHADDVAQAFMAAIANRSVAVGESFHVVASGALTLRGYAEAVSAWYGNEPELRFLPWHEWRQTVDERSAQVTWDHIARSPHCSIAKATRLLGFHPRYTSLEAIRESLEWLAGRGLVPALPS